MSVSVSGNAAGKGGGEPFQPVAALLGFLLPGLGHAYLGEVRRGVLAGVGVLGLFFGGLLVGGIDSVDRREDFVWFLGQALVGPVAFGVDYAHQNHFKSAEAGTGRRVTDLPESLTGKTPRNVKSLGRPNELGTLFCTVAGMMNLICVLDAAFRKRVDRHAVMPGKPVRVYGKL